MSDPVLALRGLYKRFGGLSVTNDVSLDVRPGEIHALIGPNGAGKTTLIHLISGTIPPDAGAVIFNGQDVTLLPFHRRSRLGLGRTFQITSLIPGFSVRDNVALAVQATAGSSWRFFRRASDDAALNRAAMEHLEEAGLADRADRLVSALSHGEKRLVELTVALAQGPRLLLLDEPLAGAGPEETERLIARLSGVRTRCPILLVEHDMAAVFALADRISVLDGGVLLTTGTADEIRAHPAVREAYLGEDALA